jgi:hypothetical protein
MEIGPVTNFRNMLAVKPRSPDLEPPSIFEIDSSSRAGDQANSSGRERPSLKHRGDDLEDDEFTLAADTAAPEFSRSAIEPASRHRVNIFA